MANKDTRFSGGTDSSHYIGRLYYSEESTDVKNNKSKVNLSLVILSDNSQYTFWGYNNSGQISVDGAQKTSGSSDAFVGTDGVTLCSWSGDITHNSNGKKTITLSYSISSNYAGSTSGSVSFDLTNIDRNAITISNYNLKECKQKKLSINFSLNYAPSSIKYRYKKSSASSWETDWINYNQYGGSYNSNTKTGYFTTPQLQASTNYNVELKVVRDYNDVSTTKSGTFYVECPIFLKKNGSWIEGEVYIKVNGAWKKGTTIYIKKSGVWKEAG